MSKYVIFWIFRRHLCWNPSTLLFILAVILHLTHEYATVASMCILQYDIGVITQLSVCQYVVHISKYSCPISKPDPIVFLRIAATAKGSS